jgi:PPOX class probable F420-dependent enzyme
VELGEEAITCALARAKVARLATLDADGRARLVPVVFVHHAGALWSPVDAKRKRGPALARLARLAHDPRATVLVDHYARDWTQLWWIELQGQGSVVRPAAPERDPALAPVVAALRHKYPQYATTPLFLGPPTLLRIEIERVRSWAATPSPAPPRPRRAPRRGLRGASSR